MSSKPKIIPLIPIIPLFRQGQLLRTQTSRSTATHLLRDSDGWSYIVRPPSLRLMHIQRLRRSILLNISQPHLKSFISQIVYARIKFYPKEGQISLF